MRGRGAAVPPVTLLIKPASSLCNMRCKYCFYADVAANRDIPSYGIMSEETLEHLVKGVFAYAEQSVSFGFQGGEPTLAGIGFYRKLVLLQEKYNAKHIAVYNSIQTNGYLLNEEWAEFFKAHGFLVGLSLDGSKEVHDKLRVDAYGKGTYGKVRDAAALLARHGVDFNILCVVSEYAAEHPRQVYNALKQYKYLQFIPCLDPLDGWKKNYSLSEKKYAAFLNETFRLYAESFLSGEYVSVRNFDNYIGILLGRPPENCAMNGRCAAYYLVEGDGSVFPCDFYVLDRWKLGNVAQDSFADMATSEKLREFTEESLFVTEECKRCPWYPLCRGGCKRDREPFIDGHPGRNRLCESFKHFFAYSYPVMLKMAHIIQRQSGK